MQAATDYGEDWSGLVWPSVAFLQNLEFLLNKCLTVEGNNRCE